MGLFTFLPMVLLRGTDVLVTFAASFVAPELAQRAARNNARISLEMEAFRVLIGADAMRSADGSRTWVVEESAPATDAA